MNSAQNFLMTSFRIFENAIHSPNKSCVWDSVTFVRSFYTQTSRSHNTQLHPSITDVIFELKSRLLAPIWPGSWRCMWLSAVGTGHGLQTGRLQLWRWVQAATFLNPTTLPNLPFCSESGWRHPCGQEGGGTCDQVLQAIDFRQGSCSSEDGFRLQLSLPHPSPQPALLLTIRVVGSVWD